MEAFRTHTGLVAPLDAQHVDTDQIIPKQFLKQVGRTGLGQYLFCDWRYADDGTTPNRRFALNEPRYEGASVLLTRDNFGCGSAREHAQWALMEYGFRSIVAPSFADTFYNNCFKNGILPVVLPAQEIDRLFREVDALLGYELAVDLERLTVTTPSGRTLSFEVNAFRRHCLLNGLDDIDLTLQQDARIAAYEAAHPPRAPTRRRTGTAR